MSAPHSVPKRVSSVVRVTNKSLTPWSGFMLLGLPAIALAFWKAGPRVAKNLHDHFNPEEMRKPRNTENVFDATNDGLCIGIAVTALAFGIANRFKG